MHQTSNYQAPQPFLKRLDRLDWIYALALFAGAFFAFNRYSHHMDLYEQGFLFGAAAGFSWFGWFWKPVRPLIAGKNPEHPVIAALIAKLNARQREAVS